jgi:hypothetical protein
MKVIIPIERSIHLFGLENYMPAELQKQDIKCLYYFAIININDEDRFMQDTIDFLNNSEHEDDLLHDCFYNDFYYECFRLALIHFLEQFKIFLSRQLGYLPDVMDVSDSDLNNALEISIMD